LEIEGPHQHHHGHGTGTRWLDISLALSAFVVSLVSLYLGIHSAHTMEKLVASNSYPNLEVSTANIDVASGKGTISFGLENSGVGPARVEWVSLSFKGKPVANISELLEACCGPKLEHTRVVSNDTLTGSLVSAGKTSPMLEWRQPAEANPTWEALHRQMKDISIGVCYCSVFDECYASSGGESRPKQVDACVAPAVPFHARFKRGAAPG
jgi:hypothetical protein